MFLNSIHLYASLYCSIMEIEKTNKLECKNCGHDWEWHMPNKLHICLYKKDEETIEDLCKCIGFMIKDNYKDDEDIEIDEFDLREEPEKEIYRMIDYENRY